MILNVVGIDIGVFENKPTTDNLLDSILEKLKFIMVEFHDFVERTNVIFDRLSLVKCLLERQTVVVVSFEIELILLQFILGSFHLV